MPRPGAELERLIDELRQRLDALPGDDRGGFVSSDLPAVDRVLATIVAQDLAPGPLFCEWGSGLGGVCAVAALHGFTPFGIEIQDELVDAARELAEDLALPSVFAQGTFLLPGDEQLLGEDTHTRPSFDRQAWDELQLSPRDCDLIFAYPWPGEERLMDALFLRHAAPQALLLTFHDRDRVLVQRKLADQEELRSLGWM
ncbi:MAG: hypothetical protein DRQ55_03320 [Planctomycetota bacterium]|nr:MAG: hypothetical protein DRQ55_03320 [Planctomycetota bacterium]